jgi:dihydrolipoamide dehydrogenase
MTKLLFDDSPKVHVNWGHGKILGSGMLGTHSGDMNGESIGMAAEVAHDSCTDLSPARK